MASNVISWQKKKHASHVKTDYAYHHTKSAVKHHVERYEGGVHLPLAASPGRAEDLLEQLLRGRISERACC